MAKEFTLTSGAYKGRQMRLHCTQKTDIAANKSTITWTLYSEGGKNNYYSTGPTTVKINGVQVYYKARTSWDSYEFPAAKGSAEGTIEVAHADDGSKTISVEMSTDIYDGVLDNYSNTWTLDSIPRQAKIESAPDFKDQDIPTITYSNPAGENVESLEICICDTDGLNGYVDYREINKTGDLSYTFTEDDVTALKNITVNSLKLWFMIRTKIGGAYLYSHEERTFTVTENDDTKPSLNMYVTIDNDKLPTKFGGMPIKGKSKVKVLLFVEGMYGATITSLSVDVDGKTYDGWSSVRKPILVQSSGNIAITGSATDSRGFTRSITEEVPFAEYSKPLVVPLSTENAIQCYRSDDDGNRVGNSESVRVKAQISYYNLGDKNTCALQYRVKQAAEQWSDSDKWVNLIDFDGTVYDYSGPIVDEDGEKMVFALDKSYTVDIRAIDTIGEYDIKTFEIPTEDVALHLGAGGKNVAIGTYCDRTKERTFYSAWNAIFEKGVDITGNVIINGQTLADYIKSVINEGGQ